MSVSDLTCSKVSDALDSYWHQHHIAPTVREVMFLTGINSSSMVSLAYEKLAHRGEVRMLGKGRARAAIPAWVDDMFNKHQGD
ncbi:MAG: hypothetical protein GWN93_06085 [Deltaproteobacteria bacterium]|nr:hypothetical protein [Deltaproteobacteria bacterium]